MPSSKPPPDDDAIAFLLARIDRLEHEVRRQRQRWREQRQRAELWKHRVLERRR